MSDERYTGVDEKMKLTLEFIVSLLQLLCRHKFFSK